MVKKMILWVGMDLDKALTDFVAFLKDSRKATATILAYRKDIDQFLAYLKRT